MQEAITANKIIACNKNSSMIVALIDRMDFSPEQEKDCEEGVFGYLQSLYKAQLGNQDIAGEQYIVDIATAHIKKFPSLSQNMERLSTFMSMGYRVVQKNNYILNTCM